MGPELIWQTEKTDLQGEGNGGSGPSVARGREVLLFEGMSVPEKYE